MSEDTPDYGPGTQVTPITEHITLTCIRPEARELLDEAWAKWQAFYATTPDTLKPETIERAVYRAFYWLFRYSGVIRYDTEDPA